MWRFSESNMSMMAFIGGEGNRQDAKTPAREIHHEETKSPVAVSLWATRVQHGLFCGAEGVNRQDAKAPRLIDWTTTLSRLDKSLCLRVLWFILLLDEGTHQDTKT
jgi:hypothetical protein